jgi:hypothetical protein
MPYCPKCGGEVIGDGTPCSYCGEKVLLSNGLIHPSSREMNESGTISDKEGQGRYSVAGCISVVASSFGLIMLIILKLIGVIQTGTADWSTSAVLLLFISMAFTITGIMSGLMGLNHPQKLLSWIGLLIAVVFVGFLASVVISYAS